MRSKTNMETACHVAPDGDTRVFAAGPAPLRSRTRPGADQSIPVAPLGEPPCVLGDATPKSNHIAHILILFVSSCGVAGMTDDLPSPHRPVRLLARSRPSTFMSRWHASFHLVFGRPFFLFPGLSVLNTFLSMCSPSLLITCPYQFNHFSVIFLDACATLACRYWLTKC